jgi:hypothetical protein
MEAIDMSQQQQQQIENFDLLAVFNEETQADTAEAKLRKEGFEDSEVFRPAPGSAGKGEFREHGPDRARSSAFLQVKRTGPNPALVAFFAILFGLLAGGLTFGVVDFAAKALLVPATIIALFVGIVVGLVIGLTRKGRVQGAIGQEVKPVPTTLKSDTQLRARTSVAVRLSDPEDIRRKSKARGILLNSGGKIDRSVGK